MPIKGNGALSRHPSTFSFYISYLYWWFVVQYRFLLGSFGILSYSVLKVLFELCDRILSPLLFLLKWLFPFPVVA